MQHQLDRLEGVTKDLTRLLDNTSSRLTGVNANMTALKETTADTKEHGRHQEESTVNRFCKFISKWNSLVVGLAYWILTQVSISSPQSVRSPEASRALLPMSLGAGALFRAVMTLFSAATAWYFERSMRRMKRLEQAALS
jgi:hypothetical protein